MPGETFQAPKHPGIVHVPDALAPLARPLAGHWLVERTQAQMTMRHMR